MKYLHVFSLLLLFSFCDAVVQESSLPVIEHIDSTKYSTRHYQEIMDALEHKEDTVRVVTFNTLFDKFDDRYVESYRWPQRLPRVVEMICYLNPDVLGVQEPYNHQLNDLINSLPERYCYFGEAYESGLNAGIFYNQERFELVDSKMYQFKKNGLAYVALKDKKTGRVAAYFNTYLPFTTINERETNSILISDILEKFSDVPTIMMGDLNTFPNRPDLSASIPAYDGDRVLARLKGDRLVDARENNLLGHYGPIGSFTNEFPSIEPFEGYGTPGVILDHILVSKDIGVLTHTIECGKVDGHFPSDHMPLVVDILLGGPPGTMNGTTSTLLSK